MFGGKECRANIYPRLSLNYQTQLHCSAVSIKAASLLCPCSAALALQMLLHQTESKKNLILQYSIKVPLSFKVCFELSVWLVPAQETWGST